MSGCIVISSTKEAVRTASKNNNKSHKISIDKNISRMISLNKKNK